MNKIEDVKVSTPGFPFVCKDLNQMTVLFDTEQEAMDALKSGKLTEKATIVDANFDWQNRKNWGANVWITWR